MASPDALTPAETQRALRTGIAAARAAGELMRKNLRAVKKINQASQHDIKLELDVRCQRRIELTLRRAFPSVPILGEEGIVGDPETGTRWVVDPIDGTVNFTYGIPHACVSIALQTKSVPRGRRASRAAGAGAGDGGFESVLGIIYDPFCNELWTALRGQRARLNGTLIRASRRRRLDEAIIALGFAKERASMDYTLPTFNGLIRRVRKIRIMGAAALSLAYVATGRMDAYLEYGLRLWDIAAGGLIVECAGGTFWREPISPDHTYHIRASNQPLGAVLGKVVDGIEESGLARFKR
ncbi:MAG TPA: inositol monophosphatase family protein [Candidatus Saccharimonadales bacterium]|nr:inositol monophosphatase family protein [Candidatus Saccharimonadales bacterium]